MNYAVAYLVEGNFITHMSYSSVKKTGLKWQGAHYTWSQT